MRPIAAQEAGQAFQARVGDRRAAWPCIPPMARANISPPVSAMPSCVLRSRRTARSHALHDARLCRRRLSEALAACRHGGGAAGGPARLGQGLRHGFGVAAVSAGIPLNLVQKWLGHAQLTTTAIYADAVGEERSRASPRACGEDGRAMMPSPNSRRARRL